MPTPDPTPPNKTPSFRFGFVKFIVRDLEAMEDFYRRALGLEVVQTIELPEITEKVMQSANKKDSFSLVLYFNKLEADAGSPTPGPSPAPTIGNAHGPLGFLVRDVDSAYDHALLNGASSGRPPFDVGPSRVCFIYDPEGRELELMSVRER